MAQLYPPYLNSVLPAFAGSTIKIPFTMNPTVSNADVAGFAIQIKSAESNKIIATFMIKEGENDITSKDINNFLITENIVYEIPEEDENKKPLLSKIKEGFFYKLYLGYIKKNSNETILYSSASLIKRCFSPTIEIENLDKSENNEYPHTFTGVYNSDTKDAAEKLYSSQFIIRKKGDSAIIASSGEILHNINNDTLPHQARETYTFKLDLELDIFYTISWEVTTSNGLTKSTSSYLIIQTDGLRSPIEDSIDVEAELNRDEGYIGIRVNKKNTASFIGDKLSEKYSILLSRSKKSTNYTIWEPIKEGSIQDLNKIIYKDYTIEHGEEYIYSLQTVENSFYSARMISNSITGFFEDIFLYDGKKQLKIRYNPKISSVKTVFSENKIETLGSQYPYIFRNGNIKYKEFSLSGLISYVGDDNQQFFNIVSKEDYNNYLTDENIYNEKIFRDQVVEWLTNGEEKLFKSPTEGNMVVRLINVSLSPLEQLSRMISTFNSTVYEIANTEVETLKKYGILPKTSSGLKQKIYHNYGELRPGSKTLTKRYQHAIITDIKIVSKIDDTIKFSIAGVEKGQLRFKGDSITLNDAAFSEFTLESTKKNLVVSIELKYYKQTTKVVQANSYTQVLTGVATQDINQNLIDESVKDVENKNPQSENTQKKVMQVTDVSVSQRAEDKFPVDFSDKEQTAENILNVFKSAATIPNTLYSMWAENKILGYCLKITDEIKNDFQYYFYDGKEVNEINKNTLTFATKAEEGASRIVSVIDTVLTPLKDMTSNFIEDCKDLVSLKICPGIQTQITYAIKLYSLIDKDL